MEVIRCSRVYGIGHNPRGGRFVKLQPTHGRPRKIYERLVAHHSGYPADGGPNPVWEALRERLGMSPLLASDAAILAAEDLFSS